MAERDDDRLAALREGVDAVDDRLLALLAERADLVKQIGEVKRAVGTTSVDPERERRVLARLAAKGAGQFPAAGITAVFREIMSASVSLQSTVSVAFLGPLGTWSHHGARSLFGFAARYLEEATIPGVVDAVDKGRADFGVLPLENSTEGSVHGAMEALLESRCWIRRELRLPIDHCLVGRAGGLHDIRRVYSHPQALGQCRAWLHQNLPAAQLVHTASTAAAVKEAELDAAGAAIASPLAAELFGLAVLREGVQDQRDNATRFVCVGLRDAEPTGDDMTTVAFSIDRDRSEGSLRRTLRAFDQHGVSLTRIESRPSRTEAWHYVFVVDLEGHRDDESVAAALDALGQSCAHVRVLGSYPRHRADRHRAG